MALSEAFSNIFDNFRFHASIRGDRFLRFSYLIFYYSIFIFIRWGDRYLRCLNWLKASGLSDLRVRIETREGLKFEMDLHTAFDPLFSILHNKDYFLLDEFLPKPGNVVIDAGANIGIYSVFAASRVGETGIVVSIEPFQANFEALSRNVEMNGLKNVRPVKAGVDERAGSAKLYVHERAINHSLTRPSAKSMVIELKTIDGIVSEFGLSWVDIIKIDTEGNVPQVLNGAKDTIARFHPRIAFEHDTPEESKNLESFLRDAGYRWSDLRTLTYACHEG
ncbi:MAG: hypothetical protein COY42_27380 [Armatimonadetes bacterium CG_4_10_14_0_8_um_filter_66_14]|nr:MAG: hypothetical protein AUJ52_05065 [Elusimicrobia bacterium CG1_02_63_36]PIP83327.1 MAG: hypothetical protein COR54_10195 [Elusimicrobia bacterium CG22_combo_CG10-13_8_21_14_all_63_91]PIZ35124.1 MAG: hypothetical protein COY42_27380 [Armatimonadetes bacterium CG_4_10_14_0_8_um_filter_66_14]PJA17970.1 MAG: hypothetical protein COX66_02840 [Elusimicrobia bacterium CG_4_10_14_0_2_um_filter_63_34]PJB26397.1 MAG: hypothetical protein CO113_03735 [Elusimicrobia bacterium CG_4_9_14_3_um_filter_6